MHGLTGEESEGCVTVSNDERSIGCLLREGKGNHLSNRRIVFDDKNSLGAALSLRRGDFFLKHRENTSKQSVYFFFSSLHKVYIMSGASSSIYIYLSITFME